MKKIGIIIICAFFAVIAIGAVGMSSETKSMTVQKTTDMQQYDAHGNIITKEKIAQGRALVDKRMQDWENDPFNSPENQRSKILFVLVFGALGTINHIFSSK